MKSSVVSIGTFDGVHLGHRLLIEKMKKVSKECGLKSILVAFLRPVKKVQGVLSTIDEKLELLQGYGIDEIIILDNNKNIISQRASEFFENFIYKKLNAAHVVVGENFAFGKDREGNVKWLKKRSVSQNIKVDIVKRLKIKGKTVSSSWIRELVVNGKMKSVAKLLGRNYSISGEIVSGRGIGRQLGFPTLNMEVEKTKLLPRGVFAGTVTAGGKLYKAAIFIGERGTVSKSGKVFPEAHLLEYKGKWKNKNVEFNILDKIRDEKTFKNRQELVKNIKLDIERINSIFKRGEKNV